MIIAIDFDGTIVTDTFPAIGELKPNAKKTINRLKNEGYYIIIWTCRTHIRLLEAIDFLVKSGIKYDQINQSCPENVRQYNGIDSRKVYADLYIDDKGIGVLPDWLEIYTIVHDRLPTYSDKVIRDGYL